MKELGIKIVKPAERRDVSEALKIHQKLLAASPLMGQNEGTYRDLLEKVVGRMDLYQSKFLIQFFGTGSRYTFTPQGSNGLNREISFSEYNGEQSISAHFLREVSIAPDIAISHATSVHFSTKNGKPEIKLQKTITDVHGFPEDYPPDSCIEIVITEKENAEIEEGPAITVEDLILPRQKRKYNLPVAEALKKIELPS